MATPSADERGTPTVATRAPNGTVATSRAQDGAAPKDTPPETHGAEEAGPPLPEPAPQSGQDDLFDEDLVHRIAPVFKLLRLYSRLQVEGLEQIPEGGALLVANHTGWIGLDYAYTALSVYDARKRIVRGMAHPTWFRRPDVASFASRLGLFQVDKETMRRRLSDGDLVLIFPEGEQGAFKPERERYLLQEFHRGYVRVALETGVPLVPVAVVGGEEANPSSGTIRSYQDLLDLSLPMPQNLFPRPVKWRISFLPPVHLEGGPERAGDSDYVHEVNRRIVSTLQAEIGRLISARGHPLF